MTLDKAILQRLAVRADVTDYLRIVSRVHAGTPLGMGYGKTRFSSPRDKFRLLYLAQDPATAVAETIIRDRFQGKTKRLLPQEEFDRYSIAVIRNTHPLFLLDLRHQGASVLGVSTNAVRAKAQTAGRRFSQEIYAHEFRRDSAYVQDHQQAVRRGLRSGCGIQPRGRSPCARIGAPRRTRLDPRRAACHGHAKV